MTPVIPHLDPAEITGHRTKTHGAPALCRLTRHWFQTRPARARTTWHQTPDRSISTGRREPAGHTEFKQ